MEKKYLLVLAVGIAGLAFVAILLPQFLYDQGYAHSSYLVDQENRANYCNVDADCVSVGECLSSYIVVNKNESERMMDIMNKDVSGQSRCRVWLSNKSVVCTDHTNWANFTRKRCISTIQII